MDYQPVMGDDPSQIQYKTEWKRKGDRVNFFTLEAVNTDFFDLVSWKSIIHLNLQISYLED